MRVIRITGILSKLHYSHWRQSAFLHKRFETRCGNTEILGYYISACRGAKRLNKRHSGALFPFAFCCGLSVCGDAPIRFDCAEVVYSQHVKKPEAEINALAPPAEALARHSGPVIYGIAPKLTFGGKFVGRTACNGKRTPLSVEHKKLGVKLNITAFKVEIYRNISDYSYASCVCVFLYFSPLSKKFIFAKASEKLRVGRIVIGEIICRPSTVFLYLGLAFRVAVYLFSERSVGSARCLGKQGHSAFFKAFKL